MRCASRPSSSRSASAPRSGLPGCDRGRARRASAGRRELIVVANDAGAAHGSLPAGAVVVRGAPELGFAGGVADGLAVARGEWIALVNDDCFVEPDALAELLAAGETRRARRLGRAPRCSSPTATETINSAGLEVDELGVARERASGRRPALGERAVDVFGASATFGLFRRAMLDDLGGFDPSFFAYLEDADLAWRARMAGWRCLLAPAAIARHHHSATLGHGSAPSTPRRAKSGAHAREERNVVAAPCAARPASSPTTSLRRLRGRHGRTLAPLTGRLRGLAEWRALPGGRPRRPAPRPRAPAVARAARRRSRATASTGPPGCAVSFAPLRHPIVFDEPRRLTDVESWHGHIPFAFFAVAALRPASSSSSGPGRATPTALLPGRRSARAAGPLPCRRHLGGRRAHGAVRARGARRAPRASRPALRLVLDAAPARRSTRRCRCSPTDRSTCCTSTAPTATRP